MCRACAMHTRAQGRTGHVRAPAPVHVHVGACGMRHVHVCTCARLATGGSREAPEAARRRPRRSLQSGPVAAPHGKPPPPPPPHPSPWRNASPLAPSRFSWVPALLRLPVQRHRPKSRPGRTSPPLTQTLTLTRTSPSPSASTSTRASRTMSTRDKAHASRLL